MPQADASNIRVAPKLPSALTITVPLNDIEDLQNRLYELSQMARITSSAVHDILDEKSIYPNQPNTLFVDDVRRGTIEFAVDHVQDMVHDAKNFLRSLVEEHFESRTDRRSS